MWSFFLFLRGFISVKANQPDLRQGSNWEPEREYQGQSSPNSAMYLRTLWEVAHWMEVTSPCEDVSAEHLHVSLLGGDTVVWKLEHAKHDFKTKISKAEVHTIFNHCTFVGLKRSGDDWCNSGLLGTNSIAFLKASKAATQTNSSQTWRGAVCRSSCYLSFCRFSRDIPRVWMLRTDSWLPLGRVQGDEKWQLWHVPGVLGDECHFKQAWWKGLMYTYVAFANHMRWCAGICGMTWNVILGVTAKLVVWRVWCHILFGLVVS